MNDKPKLTISEHNVKYLVLICVMLVGAMLITHPPSIVRLGNTSYPPYPGVPNPNITQANINQTICNPNWSTSSIRPPSIYTSHLKVQQISSMHLKGNPSDFEEDHIIALTIGGNPTDPNNLAPQPYLPIPGAHEKDRVEVYLNKQVCSGKMTLIEAQKAIVNWVDIYNTQIKGRMGAVEQVEYDPSE